MIAHPPCTYLTSTGNRWMRPEYSARFPDRRQQREDAIIFFMAFMSAPIPCIAVENPLGIMTSRFRKADQYVQPWQFGDRASKLTGLWLVNLPLLTPTQVVHPDYLIYKSKHTASGISKYPVEWGPRFRHSNRSKQRSRTYWGIAQAMATQWG